MAASIYGAADRAYALTPVAVQTSAYTAAANQLVPVDTSSGAQTTTLPTAPPDRTVIGIKLINGSNAVTVQAGSGDVFDKAGGATTQTLTVVGQGIVAQYSASGAIWYVASDDLPLAQLDQRYAPLSAVGGVYNVKASPYNASGDGIHDDTAAIQAALDAAQAAGGGTVYLPRGTYLASSLNWKNGSTGYRGVHLVGAGENSTTLKKSANGNLLVMSGPATDLSGATHCAFCSLENLTVDGGGFTGMLVQSYYADNLTFERVHFQNNADTVQQTAEYWDSRYINCVWDSCGSATANATAPNLWLCNTAAASGFGASTDTVNQIYFWGCRWEACKTGAVRIERGPGGGLGQPYSIFFTDCKMESIVINGGPMLFVDTTARNIHAKHLYCYAGGFAGGYSTAQDVIVFGPQFGSLDDVLIFNSSATACIADGVTVNSPLSTGTVTLRNVRGSYTGGATPTGGHINFGTLTGAVMIENCGADNGTQFAGNVPTYFAAASPLNLVAGAVSDSSFPTTPQDGVKGYDKLNRRLYLRHDGGVWSYIPLDTDASAVTSTVTVANSAALTALQSVTVPANEPQAGSVYEVEGYGTFGTTGTPTMSFTVYWGGIGGTAIASTATITAPSSVSTASFRYKVKLTFRSTTSVTVKLEIDLVTNTGTSTVTRYLGVPSTPATVTTTSASALAVGFQWGTANASNTLSVIGGDTHKRN